MLMSRDVTAVISYSLCVILWCIDDWWFAKHRGVVTSQIVTRYVVEDRVCYLCLIK